jgi:hypothetical protein
MDVQLQTEGSAGTAYGSKPFADRKLTAGVSGWVNHALDHTGLNRLNSFYISSHLVAPLTLHPSEVHCTCSPHTQINFILLR